MVQDKHMAPSGQQGTTRDGQPVRDERPACGDQPNGAARPNDRDAQPARNAASSDKHPLQVAQVKEKVLKSAQKARAKRRGSGRRRSGDGRPRGGDNPFMTRRRERTNLYPSTGLVAQWCACAAVALLLVFRFNYVMSALGVLWDIVSPLLAGAAIAFVLNLVMERWEAIWFPRAKSGPLAALRRPICLLLSVASIVAVIAIVVLLVREELFDAISALWRGVLSASEVAGETVQASGAPADSNLLAVLRGVARSSTDWQHALESFIADSGGVSAVATSLFGWGGKLVSGLLGFIVAVVFGLYLLAGKEAVVSGFDRAARLLLPEHAYRVAAYVASVANECFSRFIFGQCVEAVVLGSLCAIGMTVLRMPYAATVGLVVGVGALIPYVGAWMAGAIGALIVFSVEPMQAIWFLVYLVALQEVDGHFVYPNVVGAATGVSSIWVLVAVFAGGSLFGLAGVLMSVPVVATVQRLVGEWAEAREAELAQQRAVATDAGKGASGERGVTSGEKAATVTFSVTPAEKPEAGDGAADADA